MSAIDCSLTDFIEMLGHGEVKHAAHIERTLREAAKVVEERAKDMLGHYQPGWAPLADATMDERERHGYTRDDPLLRSGALLAAIESDVKLENVGGLAVIGVKDATVGSGSKEDPLRNIGDVAVAMELGTDRVPARPFLTLAAIQRLPELHEIFGRALVGSLFALNGSGASISTAAIPGIPSP